MAKKCIICKKELAEDNKGFLCQYHKDKGAELAKKASEVSLGAILFVETVGKYAYDHKDVIVDAGKKAITTASNIVKDHIV